ncbi:hypothetical protein PY093_11170 [Cytobacillus sp. S13-E01]|uniref:hypothetical protein n=1 Tax=Cytobacillus sp. S13-E01 TaxID=3031326 RepID=UPI0023D7CB71|nr:hypothetical protein [Cytobacillus sp. S13-E01]MDF0727259.1 hypothetical protein [Cytobacillus sp. S13-E01]
MNRKRESEKKQDESKRGRRDELSREELMILGNAVEDDYTYDDLLKMFIDDCELRNLREHTIKYYRSELNVLETCYKNKKLI